MSEIVDLGARTRRPEQKQSKAEREKCERKGMNNEALKFGCLSYT